MSTDTVGLITLTPARKNTLSVKHFKAVKVTHVVKFSVGRQVEVIDGVQIALQLIDGGKKRVHHVGYNLSHLKQNSHQALHLFRQHHLKEREQHSNMFHCFCLYIMNLKLVTSSECNQLHLEILLMKENERKSNCTKSKS